MTAALFWNYCRFNSTTSGIGSFTVGTAAADDVSGSHVVPEDAGVTDGNSYRYYAQNADGSMWEWGRGVYDVATHTLARDTVVSNSLGTTAKISFTTNPVVDMLPVPGKHLEEPGLPAPFTLQPNYIINGAMMVSQENGSTAGTTSVYYAVDQFASTFSNGGAVSFAQVASVTPAGSPNRIRVTVTTADAAVAAGDFSAVFQSIEGQRVADLMFGTANAKSITVQFGVKAPAGTYCVVVLNGTFNRSYVAEYTISGGEANTDVVKSVTIPGDASGTWAKDNTSGMQVRWGLMAGSTFQQASGSWSTGNVIGSSNQFNFMGTNGNVFELFDVGLYEGSAAPSFQVPDYLDELLLCKRYWEKSYSYATALGTVTELGAENHYVNGPAGLNAGNLNIRFKVSKRVAPTMAVYSPVTGASGKIRDDLNAADLACTIDKVGENGLRVYGTATAGTSIILNCHWAASARM